MSRRPDRGWVSPAANASAVSFFQRHVTLGVRLEEGLDHPGAFGVGLDPVRPSIVAVADVGDRGPMSLVGFLLQALLDLFGQVVDVVLGRAYYTKPLAAARKDGRLTRVPYDPALPVDTDRDLGVGDATVIWFSQSLRGGEVRLIDYYENSGEGIPHYAGLLKSKPYVYGEHWAAP